jgi:hypothetical protein
MNRLAVLAAVAAALALTACSADEPASEPDPSATTGAATTAATETPTEAASPSADPTPSLPVDDTPLEAADGDDIDACYDGECEVEVTASTVIPFDPDTGIESYMIQEVTADTVVIGTHIGAVQSGIGTCSSINDVAFTLRSVTGGTAIVAFFPADECEN